MGNIVRIIGSLYTVPCEFLCQPFISVQKMLQLLSFFSIIFPRVLRVCKTLLVCVFSKSLQLTWTCIVSVFFFNVYQNWSILSHQPVLWSKHLSKPQTLHSAPRFKDLVSVKRKQHFGTKLPPVKLLKLKCLLKQTSLSYIMSDIWYPSHESQHCVSEVKSTEGLYLRVKQPSRNYGINEKWSDLR